MKSFSKLLLLGLLGGIVGGYLFIALSDRNSANISNAVTSTLTPLMTPGLSLWEGVVAKLSSGFVGIQAFSNGRALRQGSGIVVSSDGLIVATADLAAPKGAVYQIFYEDKTLQALVVSIDTKANLLLLKTSAISSDIVELSTSPVYSSGQELILIGRIFDLSTPVIASQKSIVSYTRDKLVALDTAPADYLYGFGAVNSEGKLRGLIYLRSGKVLLVTADAIEKFFKSYID